MSLSVPNWSIIWDFLSIIDFTCSPFSDNCFESNSSLLMILFLCSGESVMFLPPKVMAASCRAESGPSLNLTPRATWMLSRVGIAWPEESKDLRYWLSMKDVIGYLCPWLYTPILSMSRGGGSLILTSSWSSSAPSASGTSTLSCVLSTVGFPRDPLDLVWALEFSYDDWNNDFS